jgi:hypothetical protein
MNLRKNVNISKFLKTPHSKLTAMNQINLYPFLTILLMEVYKPTFGPHRILPIVCILSCIGNYIGTNKSFSLTLILDKLIISKSKVNQIRANLCCLGRNK